MTENSKANLVTMGRVVSAFGVLGFIKIKTDSNSDAISLSHYTSLHVNLNGAWSTYKVTKSFPHESILNAKLEGINDRDAALQLKNARIAVNREDFPQLQNPNEFYWVDLIGLTVINREQLTLGKVTTLMDSGANSVLVVTGEKEHLIPFVQEYILNVDLTRKEIIVDWGIDY